MSNSLLQDARRWFHQFLIDEGCLVTDKGVPSIADGSSVQSRAIAVELLKKIQATVEGPRLVGQSAGSIFEGACAGFLELTFPNLGHLRPGDWAIGRQIAITRFEQYEHLSKLAELARNNSELAAAMVSDYLVKPDVVVSRMPIDDEQLNADMHVTDEYTSRYSPIRASNGGKPLLHASVSCKWTIRSDRSQNTRSEALSLVRNRKGRLPHIVAITAEPLPQRIASIALGTGDMDCVYHIALPELEEVVNQVGSDESKQLLTTMVSGKLLRDIADLPLDLTI